MTRSVVGMIVLASLAYGGSVQAAGDNVTVTPGNISSQPLDFRITGKAVDGGAVRFEVTVTSGRDSVADHHDGQLQIPPREATRQSADGTHVHVLQSPTLWCSLRDVDKGGTLHYNFTLPGALLPQVQFHFLNQPGLFTVYTYMFQLEEFWSSR